MPYAKRMFKRYRKNFRNNRALTTRRIFANKSAKSQAKQIYALRRAVNSVKKQCAPEVKVYDTNVLTQGFTGTMNNDLMTPVSNTNTRIVAPVINQGTADYQRIGDKIKVLPLTLFLNGIYRKITHSSSGIPMYNLLNSDGCGMRVVAVQSNVASSTLPSYTDIFTQFETSANSTLTMINLNCPFKTGITTKYTILYNKVFYFNDNAPVKNLKLKLFPKIKYLRWEAGVEYPQGQITLFVLFGGLQSTGNNLNESDYNTVELTHWLKFPYTDA